MTINRYAEAWCYEKYTIDREDFYVSNAYYVLDREWNDICRKVMIFAPLVYIIAKAAWDVQIALGLAAVLVATYFMFGVRKIDANDTDMKHPSLFLATVLGWSVFKLPNLAVQIFIGLNIILYVYMVFFKTANYRKNRKRVEKSIEEEDYKEEEEAKKYYSSWKEHANEESASEPKVNNIDPLEAEAEKLFYGYTENKDILKTRYRQLAKIHHPDHGGNEELFKCINNYYEYHKAKFA